MSATNRGAIRKESDFYATPLETVYSFLDNYDGISPTDTILEPSAGNGNIIQALRTNNKYIANTNIIDAYEIREEERNNLYKWTPNVMIENFLTANITKKYDVIIGNPPYSKAQEFIEKSMTLLKPGGRLIFLLRTNFLESKRRFDFWQKWPLKGLYVLSKRPSFTGKGTDATSYAWFVWEYMSLTEDQIIEVIGG